MALKIISRDFMRMLMLQMPSVMDEKIIIREFKCSIKNRNLFKQTMREWSKSKAYENYNKARSKKKKEKIVRRYYKNHQIRNIAMHHSQKVPFKFKLINEQEFIAAAGIYVPWIFNSVLK